MLEVPAGLDVEPRHWAMVDHILARYAPGLEVWAFGSRTKGAAKPHSDLDLAVITSRPMPIAQSARLSEAFSESDLPWRVDLVDWATTQEPFRRLIASHKVVVRTCTSNVQP